MLIYRMVDPRTQEVMFVGSTSERYLEAVLHYYVGCSQMVRMAYWFHDLFRQGLMPVLELLEEAESPERIDYWIKHYYAISPNLINKRLHCGGVLQPNEGAKKFREEHFGFKNNLLLLKLKAMKAEQRYPIGFSPLLIARKALSEKMGQNYDILKRKITNMTDAESDDALEAWAKQHDDLFTIMAASVGLKWETIRIRKSLKRLIKSGRVGVIKPGLFSIARD